MFIVFLKLCPRHVYALNITEIHKKVNAKLAAAEEALALSIWATATICRVLSIESVLLFLIAIFFGLSYKLFFLFLNIFSAVGVVPEIMCVASYFSYAIFVWEKNKSS